VRQRLHWLALHGVIRFLATVSARLGDPLARLVADPAVRADPVPFYNELRADGPLVRSRIGYLAVDHAVLHELLRSDDFGVVSLGANLPGPLRWLERHTRGGLLHPLRQPSLLAVEPPEHTRYRKTVSSVFTPRAVAVLRERVQQTADLLLDQLVGQPGVVDVVERYCMQLPFAIIGDILGVPEQDRPRLMELGELAAPSLDTGLSWSQYRQVQHGLDGLDSWLAEHLAQLRCTPDDDLMSQLVRASDDGAHLNDSELRATAGLMLVAGFETIVNLLSNGIRMLIDAPAQLGTLHENPDGWSNAIEEILRLESPLQNGAPRVARKDTELAGMRIRRGEMVVLCLAAANRDPAVFDDPDRFDIARPNAIRHLAFSGGRHFCPGAALARVEGEVGLRAFFERFPNVQLAGAGVRRDTQALRGWSTLPVTLGPAQPILS
jgi:cytochrome P450